MIIRPVILPKEAESVWLDADVQGEPETAPLLVPYPEASMRTYPVSTLVNAVRNDVAECIEPLHTH